MYVCIYIYYTRGREQACPPAPPPSPILPPRGEGRTLAAPGSLASSPPNYPDPVPLSFGGRKRSTPP